MSEHLSDQHIERYRLHSLSTTELLSADDHLVICETCRRHVSRAEDMPATVAALRTDLMTAVDMESDHIPYEQMADYVDSSLDEVDREIGGEDLFGKVGHRGLDV